MVSLNVTVANPLACLRDRGSGASAHLSRQDRGFYVQLDTQHQPGCITQAHEFGGAVTIVQRVSPLSADSVEKVLFG